MHQSYRWGLLAILLLLVAVVAQAAPAPGSIGIIDLNRVSQDYKGYATAQTLLRSMATDHQKVFESLQKGMGLTKVEYLEYKDLAGHAVKVDPMRIKELEELAKKNLDEYDVLQKLKEDGKELTAEQKARLDVLDAQLKDVSGELDKQWQVSSDAIQKEVERYTKTLTELVDKGIDNVAKDLKLGIVLSKDLQNGQSTEKFVLWGGADITEDVLKNLNDSFKAELLVAPTPR